ncbi:M4 family metallopeptidase [Longispora fulva]|uniref:Zn-dependent metalloprotease n=1 Tax=Longispora fulva TaxID=619741 RepID=A0A8J7H0P9_9ACTN|nr:M4 family metallopeptidase [Longispora fulva]MBG6141755.1 Zn-dependent metalloprotease [Longispora fulva]
MSSRKMTVAIGVAVVAVAVTGVGLAQAGTGASGEALVTARKLSPQDRAAALQVGQSEAVAAAKALGLGAQEKLVVKDVVVDSDGSRHVRYDRTYAGLPVVGGDLIVHRAPGGAVRTTQKAVEAKVTVPSTTPKISGSQAAASAAAGFAAGKASPELVVYAVDGTPTLAYRSTVEGTDAAGQYTKSAVVTDAQSGAVITSYELIHDVVGTGKGQHSGTVSLDTTQAGSSYSMTDPVRGNTRIYDAHGASENSPSQGATLFTDADNTWGSGTSSDRATAGVDANYGLAKTWDFYKNTFGRSGIRGDGVGASAYVHVGSNLLNAYWQDDCFCMVFGDGNSQNNYTPLTALDVDGHELTHGVTSATAGLQYQGESGGLNEATSDIFGTTVEFYANNASDPGDYYIGEKIGWNVGNAGGLRRMDDPTLDGQSKGCWYSGVGNLDVHLSSGVGNHFFYLLSEGSGAKTIGGRAHNGVTCNSSTVAGIGRDKAIAIYYRALTTYMGSTTNYSQARTATLNAAKDLYGASSVEYWQTSVAWAAVSVGTAVPSPTTSPTGNPTTSPTASPTASPTVSPTAGPGGNLIANPGFESGVTGWTQSAQDITNSTQQAAHGGSWYAWMNGVGSANTETVSQSVTIPATASGTLTFWLKVTTAESGSTVYDTLKVQAGSTTLATYSNANASAGYVQKSVNLAAYRGQTITLKFLGAEDAYLQTTFLVDDVSLT